MKNSLKRSVAILLVLLLSEVAPTAVNSVLLLILVGIVLNNWVKFAWLSSMLGMILGNPEKE